MNPPTTTPNTWEQGQEENICTWQRGNYSNLETISTKRHFWFTFPPKYR